MPFINTIPAAEAKNDVRAMYQRQSDMPGVMSPITPRSSVIGPK